MFRKYIIIVLFLFLTCSYNVFASPAFLPLINAIDARDYDTVNNMLLANTTKSLLKERDSSGRTILHYAANRGNTKVLGLILTAGADANALDNEGQTPLFYAVNRSYEDNVRMLISSGANANIANKLKFTPLLLAAQKGKPKIANILIRSGANVNVTTPSGATPLLFAAAKGNHNLIELLLRSGANMRARDKLGNTAMHYAAKNNRNKVVKDLLPLINKRNNKGQTPLDIAAMNGEKSRNMTSELLKNGAKTGK